MVILKYLTLNLLFPRILRKNIVSVKLNVKSIKIYLIKIRLNDDSKPVLFGMTELGLKDVHLLGKCNGIQSQYYF